MNTKKLVPQEFSGNDFHEIIGAPLIAASKANAAMAREQVEFLLKYGFIFEEGNYTPRMITMSITRSFMEPQGNEEGGKALENATAIFEIPLITLLPLSSLAVEKITLDFDFEVTSEINESNSGSVDNNGESKRKPGLRLRGRVGNSGLETKSKGRSQYTKQSKSLFKVSVITGTLPLPTGVKMMLDLYSKALTPKELK